MKLSVARSHPQCSVCAARSTVQTRSCWIESAVMPQLTVGQAAELLGVSPDTVRRLADRGELKASRTQGGRRRFDGAALARYAQRKHAPPSGPTASESARNR